MLRLLSYLVNRGVATNKVAPDLLDESCHGLPTVTSVSCSDECGLCVSVCPTAAIRISDDSVNLDRGSCIGCNLCVEVCPTGTLVSDRSTAVWSYERQALVLSNTLAAPAAKLRKGSAPFSQSLAVRVVATGCSACDLEVVAASNPIFDLDRFGISVVASPRFADALLITGPVPKAMHEAVLSTYEAMADPKIVIACGSCAISGGVHAHGYAEANGVGALLPVDVFIPGCPPHPWQIIRALLAAKKLPGRKHPETNKTNKEVLPAKLEPASQKIDAGARSTAEGSGPV